MWKSDHEQRIINLATSFSSGMRGLRRVCTSTASAKKPQGLCAVRKKQNDMETKHGITSWMKSSRSPRALYCRGVES